eukprot:TRINITY_DN30395_c0_g2_i1.p1 TRINITY_DN30395_c0_g2~~TRINITY_DN30395_c0_g2_i1.p1  ORF type:complete len:563 (-),score=121.99 TRINITY_DN30395_c0_g2_i1:214-1902(-)
MMEFPVLMTRLRDNSFVRDMTVDPEAEKNRPNQKMREVKLGHYVPVAPRPLPTPDLVIWSPEMASELGLSEDHCASEEFTRFFSGDVSAVPGGDAWATPYALSIYGDFQENSNCPFGNGFGYGDGRAISIQEVLTPGGARWELQLKGAGTTPFCRGGDGRAVLRSSIREFLASEAMHHLGVGTTRALSLVVSRSERVRRPAPEAKSRNTMLSEPCAITCRTAPSFLRVGHFELFGRRLQNPQGSAKRPRSASCVECDLRSLQLLVDHALAREVVEADHPAERSASDRAWALLRHAARAVAEMTAQWLRVGFCQGNFNSDNCLISGRTMDYGPFGFVETFSPRFGSWVGSGSHFAFMNQPKAGLMNLRSLTEALTPLLVEDEEETWQKVQALYMEASEASQGEVWRRKLGLSSWTPDGASLLRDLLELMESCDADWTITWRQLADCLELPRESGDDALIELLIQAQSDVCSVAQQSSRWLQWLKRWDAMIGPEPEVRAASVSTMRRASPRYVPREWMLKEAYQAAQEGDFSIVRDLFQLFKHPYEKQEACEKYYTCKPVVRIS